ncbi:MAG: O-antigen ligase family protein [Chloroflexi bacterium]|nr:O-antigen ligase family protein [Chloroflexota bacterium]
MLSRTSPSALVSAWTPQLLLALAAVVVSGSYGALAAAELGGVLQVAPPVLGAALASAAWWTAQDRARGLRWLAAAAVAAFVAVAIVQTPPALLSMALVALGGAVLIGGLRIAGKLPDAGTTTAMLAAAAVALVPFRGLGEIAVGPSVVGLSDFALGAALVVWLGGHGRGRIEIPRLALAIALFAAWLGITGVLALDPAPVLKETIKWLQVAVAVVLLADVLRHADARIAVAWLVGVAVAAEAAVGLVQAITGIGPAAFNVGGLIRSFGTFEQPNPFGGYLGLHLPLLLAGAIYARRSRRPWIAALWLLVLVALVISRSRGAWIGMIGSTAIVLLAAMPRVRVLGAATVALIIAGFLAFAGWQLTGGLERALPDPARAAVEGRTEVRDALRIVVDDDFAISERLAQWEAGWRMFMSAPLIGVGAGNYDEAYSRFNFEPFLQLPGHAHNIYLNFAAEAGLPATAAFLALSVWAIWRCVRAVQWVRGTPWEWATIGALGGMVAFSLHNLVDSLFVNGMGLVFALFIGLSYAIEWDCGRRQAPHVAGAAS